MARRSLGTLTVDLIARTGGFVAGMDKADKRLIAWRRQAERDLKVIGNTFKVASAAAVASITAITVQTVRSATEISRFAQLTNTTAAEFQRFAVGAKVVGIEQEKLADVLKDVNDKVGDFLQTGGGPLKDFFEQIAPKVGVTADQFRKLSGPEALQLYVSSLEKANVSQTDFTFFLEAIANDATLLLPLLRNNGEALNAFADAAQNAGGIIGDDVIAKTDQLSAALFLLEQRGNGLKVAIGVPLVRVLSELAGAFAISGNEAKNAAPDFREIALIFAGIAATGVGASTTVLLIGKTLGAIAAGTAAQLRGDVDQARAVFDEFITDISDTSAGAGQLIQNLINGALGEPGSTTSADARLKEIADLFAQMREQAASTGESSGSLGKVSDGLEKIEVSAKRAKDTLSEWIREQDRYSRILDALKTDEEQLTDTLNEQLEAIKALQVVRFGSDAEARRRAISAAGAEAPEYGGLDAVVGGPLGELAKIDEASEKLEEWRQNELSRYQQYLQDKIITLEEYNEREREITEEHQDELQRIEDARRRATFAATEDLFGNLAELTGAFIGEQSNAYKALFAISKAAAIAESIVNIQAALAKAANNPFPANLAAIATVAGQTASIISTIQAVSLSGQAHDGLMSVPKTGTYLLEKGERVTTAETSKKLDAKLDGMGSGGVRIINAFDTSEIGGYMGSTEGEKVIMNVVRKNQRTIRSLASV